MPVGHKQFTEIAREIDRDGIKLLVLDEPTAVLTESEAEILVSAMRTLAAQGISIIFISHRLHEVLEVADRVVVLRDGKLVREARAADTSVREVSAWMVGHDVAEQRAGASRKVADDGFLSVSGMWVDMPGERVNDVSFSIGRGEIFGIGGLAGQGKLGIPNGIMGLQLAGGEVTLDGVPVPLNDPRASLAMGMAFVSEDRRGVGLLLDESLDWNIAFTAIQAQDRFLSKAFGLRDERGMRKLAAKYVETLEIKCTGVHQKAKELSGGNQQKVCLAKAFALEPKLLFVSEPTRGIDVGAKRIVLDTLIRYNRELGMTVVMISSELEELRSICDRVAIVDEGRVAGILPPDAPLEDFGLLMSGRGALEDQEVVNG
jgi:simple sugar transport system ATP-binding protein